ncbi:LysR family transcriptional regulator [Phreatobacter stygius]|uniref:LysR family transcriptional regulator n=1 Tax=Phreatobacter stygius TaxID=1940610 RepID=A0A4D7B395_9HYPH|nr:LysR family transcriptional regulator [Phreatobacter stygius]QCI65028.1 LysR family transcriptional regulator [Phreatobacter stygius]
MIDFKALETLVWVATLKSFHRAAVKLNTTQPAVSQRIAQLETEIGARLLEREKRNVVPTEAGRHVLDYADRLLRLRSEMLHGIADRSAIRGTLRLGVAETVVHTWLSRFVERMAKAYPKLALEIEVDISPNLRDRLVAQEIDLAFMLGPLVAPSLKSRPLCTYPLGFFASDALGLPPSGVTLQALAAHPIVTFSRNTRPYMAIRELFSASGLPPTHIHASASLATILRMAEDGLGIAAIPSPIAADKLTAGQLKRVDTMVLLPDLDFVAAWRVTPDAATIEAVADLAGVVAAGG